jgi:hypothetical protein
MFVLKKLRGARCSRGHARGGSHEAMVDYGPIVATAALAQVVVREDWPAPFNLVAAPQPCVSEDNCSIVLGWNEPFENPLPPVEVVGEALACDAVHMTFEPDWPHPTTTRVYLNGALVPSGIGGEHPDDKIGFEAHGLARGVSTWQLDSYSTRHGVE